MIAEQEAETKKKTYQDLGIYKSFRLRNREQLERWEAIKKKNKLKKGEVNAWILKKLGLE